MDLKAKGTGGKPSATGKGLTIELVIRPGVPNK